MREKGFGLIELLVAISVFSVFAGTLVGAFILSREGVTAAGSRNRAGFIAEEGLEGVRNIRDDNFNLLTNGTHGLIRTGGVWEFSGGSDITGVAPDTVFTRTITIEDVPFPGLGKLVTVTVKWQQSPSREGSVTLSMVLTNWLADWTQPPTTTSGGLSQGQPGYKIKVRNGYSYIIRNSAGPVDFTAVKHSDSSIRTAKISHIGQYQNLDVQGNYAYVTSDAQSELKVVDISDPNLSFTEHDLPLPGTRKSTGIAIGGNRIYMVLQEQGGNPGQFVVVDIDDPGSPEFITSIDLPIEANVSQNEVCLLEPDSLGHIYAYVGIKNSSQEIQIVDVTDDNLPEPLVGFNVPEEDTRIPQSLACFDNTLVAGFGEGQTYIYDVSNRTLPALVSTFDATPSSSAGVWDFSLGLQNSLLFAATHQTGSEVKVIDISNLALPEIINPPGYPSPNSVDLHGVDYYPATGCAYFVGDQPDIYFNLCPN